MPFKIHHTIFLQFVKQSTVGIDIFDSGCPGTITHEAGTPGHAHQARSCGHPERLASSRPQPTGSSRGGRGTRAS